MLHCTMQHQVGTNLLRIWEAKELYADSPGSKRCLFRAASTFVAVHLVVLGGGNLTPPDMTTSHRTRACWTSISVRAAKQTPNRVSIAPRRVSEESRVELERDMSCNARPAHESLKSTCQSLKAADTVVGANLHILQHQKLQTMYRTGPHHFVRYPAVVQTTWLIQCCKLRNS